MAEKDLLYYNEETNQYESPYAKGHEVVQLAQTVSNLTQTTNEKIDEVTTHLAHVENKTKMVISVFDFGAIGDRVTDDTDAIQRAIDATPEGGILDTGGHRITKTLIIRKRITLRGNTFYPANDKNSDDFASKLQIVSNNFDGESLIDATAEVKLENICLSNVSETSVEYGIKLEGASLYIQNAIIQGFATGAYIKNSYYTKITNSWIGYCDTAIEFDGCLNANIVATSIQVNLFNETGRDSSGIKLVRQSDVTISNCSIERFNRAGIEVQIASRVTLFGTYFEGVKGSSDVYTSAISAADYSDVNLYSCHIWLNDSNYLLNALNTENLKLVSIGNKIAVTSGTLQNTVYGLPSLDTTKVFISGDNVTAWDGGNIGSNVSYTNVFSISGGVGEYKIDFPRQLNTKRVINTTVDCQQPFKTQPTLLEDGMMAVCSNQGFGADDFVGIQPKYGYGTYKAVRNNGQWEKVGIRLPNQPNSTAAELSTLTADFNSLLEKLRKNGVMV